MSAKNRIITIRLTEDEYNRFKKSNIELQKKTGLKVNTSALVRHVLRNSSNFQFLMDINFISYQDYMDATLFHKKKFVRDF
jgi:hypothetical protein